MTTLPDFRSAATIKDHIAHTMAFYHPRCIDASGGFYHFFKDDGSVYDHANRHLVSSARFIFNYAMAYRQFGNVEYLEQVRHGLRFLRDVHRDPATGGYAWQLRWSECHKTITDSDNHCYGLAFVLLAYAHALMAGVTEAHEYLDETYALMEARFWQPEHGLYADQARADWSRLDSYRGQNANMHACEALLAAFDATGQVHYLHRAETLAHNITVRQAVCSGGMIWEHYHDDWSVDWNYNRDDPRNLFRPWGYQPGHFTEWAKLLVLLERHAGHLQRGSDWLLPRAESLFSCAVTHAWHADHGGIHYGFAPDFVICDSDKYFWAQAETLAAAALLAERTGNTAYWDWYQKIWAYSWQHFVDHRHGAWYRILSSDNRKLSNDKSPAGKTDYHTMGACHDILRVLQAEWPRVVCAGEALTDLIHGQAHQWRSQVGGSSWNVARVLSGLGVSTAFAGAISRDIFGDTLWQASADAGLDLRFLQRNSKSPLLAIVAQTHPPDYFFVGDDSADLQFDPQQLPFGWQGHVQWVHFGGISLAREPLSTSLLALAAQLKTAGVRVSYDPNFRKLMDRRYDSMLQQMTALSDVVKVSDDDLRGLFRTDDLDAALAQLRSFNPRAAYLYTRGDQGASLHVGADSWHAPAPAITVADSVGAGDASIAGFLFSVIEGANHGWDAHLRFAVAAGAAACLAAGASPPTLGQIESLLNS